MGLEFRLKFGPDIQFGIRFYQGIASYAGRRVVIINDKPVCFIPVIGTEQCFLLLISYSPH